MASQNKMNKAKNSFCWRWKSVKEKRCTLKRLLFYTSAFRLKLKKEIYE